MINLKVSREELRLIKTSLKLYYDLEHLDFTSLSEHPSIKEKLGEKIRKKTIFENYIGISNFLSPISKVLQLVITGDEEFKVKKSKDSLSLQLYNKL